MFFKSGKSKDSGIEKRRDQRAVFFQPSYFIPVNRAEQSGAQECWFSNISEGGLAFETSQTRLNEGDEVKVLYKIGTQMRKDVLKIQFASQFLDKYRYGCAFIDSDESRKVMIDEYFKMSLNTDYKK